MQSTQKDTETDSLRDRDRERQRGELWVSGSGCQKRGRASEPWSQAQMEQTKLDRAVPGGMI